jgi:hypothetical protein
MENKLKKYLSALVVAIVFSGFSWAEETRKECVDRVGNECRAAHGNHDGGFNAEYHNCLEQMMLCPGFGE